MQKIFVNIRRKYKSLKEALNFKESKSKPLISIAMLLGLILLAIIYIPNFIDKDLSNQETDALKPNKPVTLDTSKINMGSKASQNSNVTENMEVLRQISQESYNYNNPQRSTSSPQLQDNNNSSYIEQKVLVIIWDNHESPGHQQYKYYNPLFLTNSLAGALETASAENNFSSIGSSSAQNVNIKVVDTIKFTSDAPQKPGTVNPNSGTFDYVRMINEFNICKKVNNNEIDEVWLWADRTGGFWEAIMAGPSNQIFNTNATPIIRSDCNRAVHIMGFNYEVWVDNAMHSFGHRAENTIALFLDGKYRHNVGPGDTAFEFMGKTYSSSQNRNYVGNTHYPANTNQEYKYKDQNTVSSDFLDWNAQHLGQKSNISCSQWNCDHLQYQIQWFQHLPGRCKSAAMKKADNTPMINLWWAIFKNQFYRESTTCPSSGGDGGSCSVYGQSGCGGPCDSACDCQNGSFICTDISGVTVGKECWNESQCGGPALKSRIEGKVYGCNNEKLQGVSVKAWGNIAFTDNNGMFRLDKAVDSTNIKLRETSILVGADATKNSNDKYFTNDYSNLNLRSAQSPASCGLVNCLFNAKIGDGIALDNSEKLINAGPARYAYRLQKPGLNDDNFEYNFVFTDQYAKSFDFKQVNCPTPTPTPLACNSVCTSDAQCSAANGSWYCARQFNYGGWSDVSSNVSSIQYRIGSGTTVYTDTAAVTGFNTHVYGTRVEQHLVKGGKVFYRDFDGTAWDQYWTDVTSNIPSNLAGTTIIDFNSYRKPNGKIEQHLIKTSAPNNIVYSQNNENGWANATWVPVTDNLTGNGTGPITGFTAYVDQDGYMIYNMVRNGQFWEGSNINGSNPNWKVQTGLSGCAGTSAGKCGSATLLSVERSKNTAGKDELYLIRGGGKMYYRESTPTDERCRHRTYPFSASCSSN